MDNIAVYSPIAIPSTKAGAGYRAKRKVAAPAYPVYPEAIEEAPAAHRDKDPETVDVSPASRPAASVADPYAYKDSYLRDPDS